MTAERDPSRELTDQERRELIRRMEVVAAIVWGTASLLYRRDPLAEAVKEYGGNVRHTGIFAVAFIAAAAALEWRDSSDFSWLHEAGMWTLICLAVFWYLPYGSRWFDAERKLGPIDMQLWEMRYRWLANGGNEIQFDDLKALHQPDIGMDRDTSEYREWWYEVRAEMQEKAMLLD